MIFSASAAFLLKVFGIFSFLAFLLYLLKLRERLIPVSSHFLWEKILKAGQRSLLARILRRFFSFLLQLLIIALAVFTLGKPHLPKPAVKSGKTLLLIDASASMQSKDIKFRNKIISRWNKALLEAEKIIKHKSPNEKMIIVTFGSRPVPRSSWEQDSKNLLTVLENLRVTDTEGNISGALNYSAELLRFEKNPKLIIITDDAFTEKIRFAESAKKTKSANSDEKTKNSEQKIEFINSGKITVNKISVNPAQNSSNIAVTALAARPLPTDSETTEVFVTVSNFSKEKVSARLDFYVDNNWRNSLTLELPAGSERTRMISMPLGGEILKTTVKPLGGFPDVLETDNTAWAVLPGKSEPRILYAGESNLFLEAAILLLPGTIKKVEADEYTPSILNKCGESENEKCNIVIFNEFVPSVIPDVVNQLYINPKGKPFDIASKQKLNYQILWTGGRNPHPIMNSVSMKDVNLWGESTAFKRKKQDIPLMQVDSRGTILGILRYLKDGRRLVGLGFSLKSSDFVLQVSFPVFILNTINWFMGTSPSFMATYLTGHTYKLHLNSDTMIYPDGEKLDISGKNLVINPEKTGIYEFLRKKTPVGHIAVSLLSSDESNISPQKWLVSSENLKKWKPFKEVFKTQKQIPWKKLIILALIALAFMFMTYMRGAWGALFAFISATLFAFDAFMLTIYAGFPLWIAFIAAVSVLLILEWFTYNRRVTV